MKLIELGRAKDLVVLYLHTPTSVCIHADHRLLFPSAHRYITTREVGMSDLSTR